MDTNEFIAAVRFTEEHGDSPMALRDNVQATQKYSDLQALASKLNVTILSMSNETMAAVYELN